MADLIDELVRSLARELRKNNGDSELLAGAFEVTLDAAEKAVSPADWLEVLKPYDVHIRIVKNIPRAGKIVSQIIEQVVRQFSPGDRAAAVRLIVAVLEEASSSA
jgi:hypothetical protein